MGEIIDSHILLVGAGALGARHLQSVCILPGLIISVVEPDQQARLRCLEIAEIASYPGISWYSSISEMIISACDIVIVACSAAPRFELAKAILGIFKPKFMILEKVVFQKHEHFQLFRQLLQNSNCQVVVNCPRRLYPFYQHMKRQLNNAPIRMNVSGVNWGLACNSIHFIDLMQWLAKDVSFQVDLSGLQDCIPSKRAGYSEISGCIMAHWDNGSVLQLNCMWDMTQPVGFKLEIEQELRHFQIDEIHQYYNEIRSGHSQQYQIDRMPFQSELTSSVIAELLEHGRCGLTPYAESMQQHISLLKPLSVWFSKRIDNLSGTCPIT